ncbi:MAG: UDP-N-acetylmuramoyl-tripeptide--D-alanyl-D-alanine ligase, partial [Lachnospiraceae bacterium]|nr:UDP-N-acetylmuramoyl-tripeptide--D-alanyl-D-alanine ligase [Lachnospiraceae bacterium]
SQAVIHADLSVFPVEIPLPGAHMVLNALAAAGVGMKFGLTIKEIKQGIADVQSVSGRSNVLSLPDYTLIDDCYNANPASMRAAIDLLSMAFGRKAAILGDMFELGEREKQLHGQIGAYAAESGIDILICTGTLSRFMYEQAMKMNQSISSKRKVKLYYFETREEMMEKLPNILKKGDTILIKASHGMQFEKVVSQLKG